MMLKDLIQKARELAALADKATPGPWEWVRWGLYHRGSHTWIIKSEIDPDCEQRPIVASEYDEQLIAAAPDMAKLLAEMVDELEDVSRLVDKAAELIGTAEEYRSTACIEVALDWCARLKDEVKTLRSKTNELTRIRRALSALANAVDPFLADQSQATDERAALAQPVTVKEAEELNSAYREAWGVLRNDDVD